jgi:predicted ATPase
MSQSPASPGHYVFLSYASVDREHALKIADLLEGNGVSVWIDRKSIAGGTSWSAEIVRGIEGCSAFALLCTSGAVVSPNVQQEAQLAWESRKPILPLLLEKVQLPNELRYALAGRQWIEVLDHPDRDWLPAALQGLQGLGIGRPRLPVADQRLPATAAKLADAVLISAADEEPNQNLPVQVTSFVGRERELAEVRGRLAETHLLTLTGAGGAGKTRLALQVAAELLNSYPDGVWFIDLAPLNDPLLVSPTIMTTLGVADEPGRAPLVVLGDYLRRRIVLLVLDNCEHLIDACAQLAEALLRQCPGLRILATSREMLGVAGELAWRVPSLSLPDPQQPLTVAELERSEAIQLFVQRARLVQPGFTLTDEIAGTLAQICRRLDGIPFAIELAAARTRALSPEQILARLDDRFRLLSGGSRTVRPRQQTLRAMVDWSYDLLSGPEQRLLHWVSVFAGSFSLEAAEAVCGDSEQETGCQMWSFPSPIPTGAILDLLFQLVDKSLVVAERQGNADRYRLLETIRLYAGEKLQEAREGLTVGARHAAFFQTLAERARPELNGPDQPVWSARLAVEHDNLRGALRWSIERDTVQGLRLAGDLGHFWRLQGDHREGRRWLENLLARTIDRVEAVDPAVRREIQVARAQALRVLGTLAIDQGDYAAATSFLEESVKLYRAAEDKNGYASALMLLGYMVAVDDPAGARRIWDECLPLAREVGDLRVISAILGYLGLLAARDHDISRARALVEESLAFRLQLGGTWLIARAHEDLGTFAFLEGDLSLAKRHWQEALRMSRQLHDRRIGGSVHLHLARLARAEGNGEQARTWARESIRQCAQVGTWLMYAGLTVMGTLLIEHGETVQGVRLHAMATGRTRRDITWFWVDAAIEEWRTILATTRPTMGDTAFATAWAEGQAMTLEQAVAYALEVEPVP